MGVRGKHHIDTQPNDGGINAVVSEENECTVGRGNRFGMRCVQVAPDIEIRQILSDTDLNYYESMRNPGVFIIPLGVEGNVALKARESGTTGEGEAVTVLRADRRSGRDAAFGGVAEVPGQPQR